MEAVFEKLDIIESKLSIFIRRLLLPTFIFFRRRNKDVANKIEELTLTYEELIDEYRKIQEGKSGLSANKRRMVEAKIVYLVGQGHIQVNKTEDGN